jgi:hypothetical protein
MPTQFAKIDWNTATPQQILQMYTKEKKRMTIEEYRKLKVTSWANIRGLEFDANLAILNNIYIKKCVCLIIVPQLTYIR